MIATTITSQYRVSILSACGEPPDSGEKASPNAVAARASGASSATARQSARTRRRRITWGGAPKTRGILFTARRITIRRGWSLTASEHGGPALEERRDALGEVAGARHLLLHRGLQGQLLLHAAEDPGVELALGAGVRARRALREPLEQRVGLRREGVIGRHAVDQPPFERPRGGDPLAEHRHLRGPGEADAARDEQRGPAVRDEPDVDEREQEVRRLGGDDEIAGQRERRADAGGRSVDGREHRLLHLAHERDDRVVALVEEALDVGRSVLAPLVLHGRDVPEVCARGEGAAGAGEAD